VDAVPSEAISRITGSTNRRARARSNGFIDLSQCRVSVRVGAAAYGAVMCQ
jgi:hypothetical protein